MRATRQRSAGDWFCLQDELKEAVGRLVVVVVVVVALG